ncbi:protocadherin beta-11-like [Dreissena polymorpha]|uniref:Cadherin domain-containing protein n=1 Tax=Dreissena polymorpha TaxID=45954 RepID=A0A9D4KH45_DREPO|nr:protocadherin beta-11-like [Dreissena polymorpha]XP_052281677.1 protocadherin beta-11-like [Dreissena polymorpha]XP_052281678.1 protocadherin beta-11-like [Dreissena polymorpha]XP_052281679.1 protocadherin beta-11-like [Dreissena polymorpha]KAH3839394.1 hypothetical protein DPMN_112824 [Dreissena polymorpha]
MWTFAAVTCLLVTFVCCQLPSDVTYDVLENKSAGVFVGNIARDTQVTQNTSEVVSFAFYEENEFTPYFQIDTQTGNITTSSKIIDFEALCQVRDCQMHFDVSVRGSRFFAIVSVQIRVLDVNDNAPVFTNAMSMIDIPENDAVGSMYEIASAKDADMFENNTIQSYRIEPPTAMFSLLASKKDRSFGFKLRLEKALDRELQDSYKLKLLLADGGVPSGKTAELQVVVNVQDTNDNAPQFMNGKYEVTINETIIPNSIILVLSAKDADSGANARITYGIKRQSNLDTIQRLFKINENTGELSVIADLTQETSELYEFIVEAKDGGDSPNVNETSVKITVNDVANNAPSIEIKLFTPGNIDHVDVEENQPTGVFVAHVNVVDSDKGINGQFDCSITNPVFVLEKFQNRGYKVVTARSLDRETTSVHNVTVICTDSGNPPKSSSKTFFVRVTDVNDNDPKFYASIYNATINEETVGAVVTRVVAFDVDLGDNGTVEYMLDKSNYDFTINKTTGVITTRNKLDRERSDKLVFKVHAVDNGTVRRNGSATVAVTLIDVNDNAPVIVPTRPEFTIAENNFANVSVGVLKAEDADIGNNGQFEFSLAPLDVFLPFIVLPSGEIMATERMDREQQNRYDFSVTVTDLGAPLQSSTHTITIYVTDENDNAPRVTFPNDKNYTVTFLYVVDHYNVVTTVAAYDVDAGDNGTLVFSIVSGNDRDIFGINPDLGEISIKNYVDIKDDTMVTLTINVRDKAVSPKSTRVDLKIQLLYAAATSKKIEQNGGSNTNIIITVVVIVATLAVAVVIVAAILFIRRKDRRKNHENVSTRYSDSGISTSSESNNHEISATENDANETENTKDDKKKKGVSFSFDGLDGGKNVESSTDEHTKNGRFYDEAPSYGGVAPVPPTYSLQTQEKIDRHMKALKLQQYLWEAKTRPWDSEVQKLPIEDSESETSRDTATCDSGRGGSDEDMSTSSPIYDDKILFGSFDTRPHKRVTFMPSHNNQNNLPSPVSSVRQSTPLQNPPHSRQQQSYHNQPDPQYPTGRLAIKSFPNKHINPKISLDNAPITYGQQPLHPAEPWNNLYLGVQNGDRRPRMRNDSESSFRSNDDGGSTTTSGSYTLDTLDDLQGVCGQSRDYVV